MIGSVWEIFSNCLFFDFFTLFSSFYTLSRKSNVDKQQGPIAWHREPSSQSCVKSQRKRIWKRMYMCVCMYVCITEWASLVAQMVKNPSARRETWVWSLSWEEPLEEGMATHSSIFAWRIPVDRGAWRAAIHGVTKGQTQLSDWAHDYWVSLLYNVINTILYTCYTLLCILYFNKKKK